MIVTEEEAKTKACPEISRAVAAFNSVTSTGPHGFAAVPGPAMSAIFDRCIGTACMAWRWHKWVEYVPDPDQPQHSVATPQTSETHGYCGKASKP